MELTTPRGFDDWANLHYGLRTVPDYVFPAESTAIALSPGEKAFAQTVPCAANARGNVLACKG